jgi:hypothetical protein
LLLVQLPTPRVENSTLVLSMRLGLSIDMALRVLQSNLPTTKMRSFITSASGGPLSPPLQRSKFPAAGSTPAPGSGQPPAQNTKARSVEPPPPAVWKPPPFSGNKAFSFCPSPRAIDLREKGIEGCGIDPPH